MVTQIFSSRISVSIDIFASSCITTICMSQKGVCWRAEFSAVPAVFLVKYCISLVNIPCILQYYIWVNTTREQLNNITPRLNNFNSPNPSPTTQLMTKWRCTPNCVGQFICSAPIVQSVILIVVFLNIVVDNEPPPSVWFSPTFPSTLSGEEPQRERRLL